MWRPGRRGFVPGVLEGQGVRRGLRVPRWRPQGPHDLGVRQTADERRRLCVLRHDPRGFQEPRSENPHRLHPRRAQGVEAGQRAYARRGYDDDGRALHGRDELPLPWLGRRVGAIGAQVDGRLRAARVRGGFSHRRGGLRQVASGVPQPVQGGGPECHARIVLRWHRPGHPRLRQDEKDAFLHRLADRRRRRVQGRAHSGPVHGRGSARAGPRG
mmetsp:Transcript_65214/g.199473  ORF Transcript_65214/g.199473 Transcript_65214/m.199473 type:complete len:214 (+) Transcript_65214:616-1257(+)